MTREIGIRGAATRAFALALAASVSLAGCGGPPPLKPVEAIVLPEERPGDFVLAATVYSPAALEDRPGLPRSLRPGRYIVEADGALRAATGAGADEQTFPPIARQLTPRQRDQLWRMVRDSAILDPASGVLVSDPTSIGPPAGTTALIWISYADTRATVRVTLDRRGDAALPAEQIVDRLAEWAWVR